MIGARPQVAVIIPAHNAAATLRETLESAISQVLPVDEIIVVDDGSTDETARICTDFASSHPCVRLISQHQQGPSAARNAAIMATDAEFIAPLDSDDLWSPDYLRLCIAALRADPAAGFAYAWHHLIDASGATLRQAMPFTTEGDAFDSLLLCNFVGNGSAAVFRRAAMIEAGMFSAPLADWPGAEDYLLELRVAGRHRVACVRQDLVAYRRSEGSLSANVGAARRARLAAVHLAAAEFGKGPLPILRWASSDADRVLAVQLAQRGSLGLAGWYGISALIGDPWGTTADICRRISNLFGRMTGAEQNSALLDPVLDARLEHIRRTNVLRGARFETRAGKGSAGPAFPASDSKAYEVPHAIQTPAHQANQGIT